MLPLKNRSQLVSNQAKCNLNLVLFVFTITVFMWSNNVYAIVIRGHFPVEEGRFWDYRVSDEKESFTLAVNGNLYLRDQGLVHIMSQQDGRFMAFKEDWEGIRLYMLYEPKRFMVPHEPILFLPSKIEIGKENRITQNSILDVYTDPTDTKNFEKTGTADFKVTFEMIGYEDVPTDNSTFKECILIEKISTIDKEKIIEHIWLYPTVGAVKRVLTLGQMKKEFTIIRYPKSKTEPQSYSLKRYYPLVPGTRCVYQDKEGKEKITELKLQEKAKLHDDVMVTPLEDYMEHIYYFAYDERGLTLPQRYWSDYGGCQAFTDLRDATVFLPASLKEETFFSNLSTPRNYSWPSMTLNPFTHPVILYSGIVIGKEDVTVPAGTFKDCLKINLFNRSTAHFIQLDSLRIGYIWLAKDLGIVKENVVNFYNYGSPKSTTSVFDVRFWQLAKHETITPVTSAPQKDAVGDEEQENVTINGYVVWEGYRWKDNSKKIAETSINMPPSKLLKKMGKTRFFNALKKLVGSDKIVDEDLVFMAVKEATPGFFLESSMKKLEPLRTKKN